MRCQHEQNRAVAESGGTTVAARRTKQGFDLFFSERPRDVIELVKNGTRDSLGEIPWDKILCAQVAKEAAQTARYAMPGRATEFRHAPRQVRVEIGHVQTTNRFRPAAFFQPLQEHPGRIDILAEGRS